MKGCVLGEKKGEGGGGVKGEVGVYMVGVEGRWGKGITPLCCRNWLGLGVAGVGGGVGVADGVGVVGRRRSLVSSTSESSALN